MSISALSFAAMGGYAPYIWPAYGLMVVLLVVLSYCFWRDRRHAYIALQREEVYRESKLAKRRDSHEA